MTILVASLIAPPILDDQRRWGSWLNNHLLIKESVPEDVHYYCAVELDGRGLAPYRESGWLEQAEECGVEFETYTYNSGRTSLHTENRLKHICLGRNIISQRAISDRNVTHIMGLDGDVTPPPDILPNLLAVDYPLVSAFIPTYCFTAASIDRNPRNPEQEYPRSWKVQPTKFSSAGAWLAERWVFSSLRWRTDPVLRLSDDPAYLYDVENVLGVSPRILQRSDTVASHWPPSIGPIETRLADPTIVPLVE